MNRLNLGDRAMKFKVIIHEAEGGGFWAEVPSLPGCFSQGETLEEVKKNIVEAIEAYLESVEKDGFTSLGELKEKTKIISVEV